MGVTLRELPHQPQRPRTVVGMERPPADGGITVQPAVFIAQPVGLVGADQFPRFRVKVENRVQPVLLRIQQDHFGEVGGGRRGEAAVVGARIKSELVDRQCRPQRIRADERHRLRPAVGGLQILRQPFATVRAVHPGEVAPLLVPVGEAAPLVRRRQQRRQRVAFDPVNADLRGGGANPVAGVRDQQPQVGRIGAEQQRMGQHSVGQRIFVPGVHSARNRVIRRNRIPHRDRIGAERIVGIVDFGEIELLRLRHHEFVREE